MALPVKPALKTALGRESLIWVPAIAVQDAPTAVEINGATSSDLTCRVFGEQEFVTGTPEKITLPRLLCELTTYQANGPTSYEAADLIVSFQPQAAALSDGKKAWEALVPGTSGFLVRRQDVDAATTPAAGQFVDVIPASIGSRTPGKTGTDASGVFSFTAAIAVTGSPSWNVALV